jgi:hypothetical protein
MKTKIKTIWCILVLAVSASATNYTVKSGSGGNYTTIQACATAMSAGDTCTVYAGTYNEHVTLSAGTTGNYKTLTVNPGDTVNVLDFRQNSHTKINGFTITNPSSPHSADCVTLSSNATDFFITNNTITACGSHAMIFEPQTGSNVNHGFIQGNTLSYSCSTSSAPNVCTAMDINGDFHLIENNDISHVSDGPYLYGAHNVFRKNTFHDVFDTDCGSNSGNCHIDFFQADANVAGGSPHTQFLLVEGNIINNMQSVNGHASGLFQAEKCNGQCFNAILRFNVASHYGSGAITDDNSGTTVSAPNSPAWINVKAYNNTWVDGSNGGNLVGGQNANFSHGSYGGSSINELFYYPETVSDFNPYACTDTACSPFTYGHNLAWCTGSPCNFRSHAYGVGAFTDDPGNQVTDPKFVDYTNNDFALPSGSPALAAGTYLTKVANSDSGSGTSVVVNDSGFFQDGYSISGVNADCIAVKTVANHVCITAVNYQTNTLTLASSITRSAGDPVWLYSDSTGRTVLIGNAPNIGATFDPASVPAAPAPPTGLTAIVQ